MQRPFQTHGIDSLESLFASGREEPGLLLQLLKELAHRTTQRAVQLRAECEYALVAATSTRPLRDLSIEEVESLFADRASNSVLVKAILEELNHRTTQRAACLRIECERALVSEGRAAPDESLPPVLTRRGDEPEQGLAAEPSFRGTPHVNDRKGLFLEKMLDRLYASLARGPALNCRPGRSRQRIDASQLAVLEGPSPTESLAAILGPQRGVKLTAPLAPLAQGKDEDDPSDADATSDGRRRRAARAQLAAIRKLAVIGEDAKEFEDETGVQSLFIGYPLVHMPATRAQMVGASRTVMAPIAFIPVEVVVRRGKAPSVEISASGKGLDVVIPNPALVAWVEKQSGKPFEPVFGDAEGSDPWREIRELTSLVAERLEIRNAIVPGPDIVLEVAPKTVDEVDEVPSIVSTAVLGLFPLENINLIHDTEALQEAPSTAGPLRRFLEAGVQSVDDRTSSGREPDRLIARADPCQADAVLRARTSECLVIHGPPGTGKSQTIANIIGDHLARGERVLFVCDKRTALDVVKQRLDATGVGRFCAVVHDAQKDQTPLYMSIREQLDSLSQLRTHARAQRELQSADGKRLTAVRSLRDHHEAILGAGKDLEGSFHALIGRWSSIGVDAISGTHAEDLGNVTAAQFEPNRTHIREVMERGERVDYPGNPWRTAIGDNLSTWLSRSMSACSERLADAVVAATLIPVPVSEFELSLSGSQALAEAAESRESLASQLDALSQQRGLEALSRWAATSDQGSRAYRELQQMEGALTTLRHDSGDSEVQAVERAAPVALAEISQLQATVEQYLRVAPKWFAFLAFFARAKARSVLERLGMSWSLGNAERAVRFLRAHKARYLAQDYARLHLPGSGIASATAEVLVSTLDLHREVFAVLQRIEQPAFASIRKVLLGVFADGGRVATAAMLLRASAARARALIELEERLACVTFVREEARQHLMNEARSGRTVHPEISALQESVPTIEELLRIETSLKELDPALARACRGELEKGTAARTVVSAIEKRILQAEAESRIRKEPQLTRFDANAIQTLQEQVAQLDNDRIELVRQQVEHHWVERQRSRLLSSTGSRLSSAGTNLKQRLLTRGSRVLKLRQVIAEGIKGEELDPIFDLRPVWMASPETVAQIFPRRELFDVVVFDESSQCRLEHAIPVMTRAKRVVIAGDPKQLPPSRFFESAVVQREEQEPETDQEFFESQQAENEDLLNAALNLQVDQAYLDVHYRSENPDLIDFSNQYFYERRLQPLPVHPSRIAALPPIALTHVGGTYEKQVNTQEARAVVHRVRQLLAMPESPSIGIACFNLRQKDAIVEALDEAAAEDSAFSTALQRARALSRNGSFEGLFVKNLENVQGDERDHMIISTTYGPSPEGKFYRRFGPLGMPGGGRRLNVLVTRARQQVHLLTSIPRDRYMSLEPVPEGTIPSGSWLLYAYLQKAEELAKVYRHPAVRDPTVVTSDRVFERVVARPAWWARPVANQLAAGDHIATVHWGNEGFLVDVATVGLGKGWADAVGVLCDGCRYDKSPDPVEWDMFRTRVLRGLGWKLERVLAPEYFRSQTLTVHRIEAAADSQGEAEKPPALRLVST